MKQRLRNLGAAVMNRYEYGVYMLFVLFSVAAFAVVSRTNTLFIYDDSVAYLNIARSSVDSIQTGINQIGSVWLPINHVLKIPMIWSDYLYRSGIAGSIISMMSYVGSCVLFFKMATHVTRNRGLGFLSSLVFALNPALLYLQTTAMSESLFVFFFVVSLYCFRRYGEDRGVEWLLVLGLVNALMVLARYEGWPVVLVEAILIFAWQMKIRQKPFFREAFGRLLIMLLPVASVVIGWLIWNYEIAGDPLYFLRGELSASAFTERQQISGVRAEGNVLVALYLYGTAVVRIIGWPVVVIASLGFIRWMWSSVWGERERREVFNIVMMRRASLIVLLLVPLLFHVFSLYIGTSSMKIAGYGGDVTSLNLRYSIFFLPYAALGTALIFKRVWMTSILVAIVLGSYAWMFTGSGLTIIDDALEGRIAYDEPAAVLRNNVHEDEKVLMSFATNSPLAFHAAIDLDTYVHEGVYREWHAALEAPETQVAWVVLSRRFEFDTISKLYQANPEWLSQYRPFYEDVDIIIYRLLK